MGRKGKNPHPDQPPPPTPKPYTEGNKAAVGNSPYSNSRPDNDRVRQVMWLLQTRLVKLGERVLSGDELWADTVLETMAIRDDNNKPTDLSLKGAKIYGDYAYGRPRETPERDNTKDSPNGRLIEKVGESKESHARAKMADLVPKGDDPQPPSLESMA